MSDVMNVYVFTGGETAKKVFDALATFFGGQSWSSLLSIIAILALGLTAIRFFISRDHNNLLHYFLVNLLVTSLLLTPKVTVRIDDSSALGAARFTDNVPIGVALPISYATTFMYGISRVVDAVFTTPDEQSYSKSGMLFGSKLIRLSNQIGIQDAKLKELWSQYTQNCIRKDITINEKYTWSEFSQSTDIFTFLKNNRPSPIRRIAMNGAFPTCQEALPQLEQMFIKEAQESFELIGTQSLISDQAQHSALIENAVANSYNTFLNIQQSATNTLKQNIAINGVKAGLINSAAKNNATAAALNYSATHSQMQLQSTLATMSLTAGEWLPIIHSVLILLLACSSIPVFLMAFIPGATLRVLKGYAGGFFLIALWPLYFTFINMIMTYELKAAGASTSNILHGLSLSGADPIMSMHMKYAAIAGGLMMLVPVIAKASLSGGMAMVGSISQQFASMVNSNASRAAGAVASGDISYGVVQTDTWQTNTANGNKFDTTYSNQTYGALTQRADGSNVNYLPGGNAVYSAQGTISRGAFDITSGAVQSQALSQSITDAQRAATQASTSYNKTAGSVTDQLMSLTHAASQNQSYGSGTQHSMNSSLQDTLTKMDGVVADEAKSKGVSFEEAYKRMVDDYFGINASGGVSGSMPIGKAQLTGNVGATGGRKWSTSDSSTDSHRTDRTSRTSSSRQNQFNDAMSALEQFTRSERTENLQGENKQAVSSISEGIKEAKQYAEAYNTSYAREQSYTSALNDTQTGSLALNQNLMPEFQQYLQNRGCDHIEAIMNGNTPAINEEREAYVQDFFEQKYANYNPELKQALDNSDVGHKAHALKGSDLQQSYQTQSKKIETESTHQQLNPSKLQNKVQTEQQKLFDNETYVEKQDTQAHSQQYIEDDLTGIKKGRGLK